MDDLGARLEVMKRAAFCHHETLIPRPARLNRFCSDSAQPFYLAPLTGLSRQLVFPNSVDVSVWAREQSLNIYVNSEYNHYDVNNNHIGYLLSSIVLPIVGRSLYDICANVCATHLVLGEQYHRSSFQRSFYC